MNFNLTPLEFAVCLLICLFTYLFTQHGRRLLRWLREWLKRRRGPRTLRPKSPANCPMCANGFSNIPQKRKLEVIPWPERKSRRGRPKTVNTNGFACLNPLCDYFAIADQEIHALVSNGCRGKQRIRYFKCQACGNCRTSRYCTPLYRLKTPFKHVAMVMTALSEGVDLSAASRIFGNSPLTMIRWLERSAHHSTHLHERLFFQAVEVGHLQLDELVTRVKRDSERVWIWTAVTAKSRLALATHIGRRSSKDAHHLLHQVWQRLKPECLPVFTSDGLNQYFYGITAHFGHWDKPPRARKHHWFPDLALQYAQLRKRRHGSSVTFLYSIIRLGERTVIRTRLKALELTGIVQTAYVERMNLTLRRLIAPLARKTWAMAHDQAHLSNNLQWGLAYYHFCRPHDSLRIDVRCASRYRHRTPAMAANLVKQRWRVQDLLQLPVPERVWLDSFPATLGCR